jgi:hypothetical protein
MMVMAKSAWPRPHCRTAKTGRVPVGGEQNERAIVRPEWQRTHAERHLSRRGGYHAGRRAMSTTTAEWSLPARHDAS